MFADPAKNLGYAQIAEGMTVADFGAGSGAYALLAARKVGPGGRVHAIDIQNNLLERLAKQARAEGLSRVHIIWGDVERLGGSKLADESVDAVIVSNLLFQVDGKYTLALEAKRILKPGGRVLLIDWRDSFGGVGPEESRVVKPDEATKIFQDAGLLALNEFDAGEHHYGLVFRKPDQSQS